MMLQLVRSQKTSDDTFIVFIIFQVLTRISHRRRQKGLPILQTDILGTFLFYQMKNKRISADVCRYKEVMKQLAFH